MKRQKLGQWLTEQMERRNKSGMQLALDAGLGPNTVNTVIRRDSGDWETLGKIAKALGIPKGIVYFHAGILEEEDLDVSEGAELTPEERAILEQYQRLSEDGKFLIRVSIEALSSKQEAKAR